MKNWKEIDIIFTKSKKIFPIGSWLIRLWTWKEYSHVARQKTILGETVLYQASGSSVNYTHKSEFVKHHKIVKCYKIKVPADIEREMAIACLRDAGKPYATMQNIGIALVNILAIFKIKISNPWKDGKNCSELLYTLILKKMYPDLKNDADLIKPHHIERILTEKGYKPCKSLLE